MTHPDFPEIVGEEEVARYVIKGKGKAETDGKGKKRQDETDKQG